jgi:hypothetical protein
MLARFRDYDLALAGLKDVADDMQILVELHGFAQTAATGASGERGRDPGIAQVLK